MAIEQLMAEKRFAVVTGGNKGIGFEICKQLASHGIVVVLTARDEKRGLEALEKLKGFGFSGNVLFHQLDVLDSSGAASLAEFINSQFGRLDILVNNAGIIGVIADGDALRALSPEAAMGKGGAEVNWDEIVTQTYELAVDCLQTNYYGAKTMVEAFVPLFQKSQSPRIVNVTSSIGKLKNIPNEWAKGILNDVNNLTEERVDEVLNGFLKDFKEGSLKAKGWPSHLSAYTVSKAALSEYTRILAKKYLSFKVNCVCPGFVKTDLNYGMGIYTPEEGAVGPVKLALLPDDGPSGLFFFRDEESSFE